MSGYQTSAQGPLLWRVCPPPLFLFVREPCVKKEQKSSARQHHVAASARVVEGKTIKQLL